MIKQRYTKVVSGDLSMYAVNVMPLRGLPHGTKMYMCDVCSMEAPETDVVWFRGKIYCRQNGCADEIRSILVLERGPQKPYNRKPEEIGRILFG